MKQDHMILPDHSHLIEDGDALIEKINHDLKVALFFVGCGIAWTIGTTVAIVRHARRSS